ncbi:MAG: hypothetical protein ABT940_10855, partial [Alphaproteobacteria bacterium]
DVRIDNAVEASFLLRSSGRYLSTATEDSCFEVKFNNATSRLECTLNVGGTPRTVSAPVGQGESHRFEASYDGANLRSFLDGALVETVACTGTLVQKSWENVVLGVWMTGFPQQTATILAGATATIGFMHISRVARHTASHANPYGYIGSTDANTCFATPWSAPTKGLFFTGVNASGIVYLPHYRNDYTAEIAGCGVSDLTIDGLGDSAGIWATHAVSGRYERLRMTGVRYGIALLNNSYLSRMADIHIAASGPFGMMVNGASGLCNITELQVQSTHFPVCGVASSGHWRDFYLTDFVDVGLLLSGVGSSSGVYKLDSVFVSTENAPQLPQAGAVFDKVRSVAMSSCGVENGFHAGAGSWPVVVVGDADSRASFYDTSFLAISGITECAHVVSGQTKKLVFSNCINLAGLNWTDDPTHELVLT